MTLKDAEEYIAQRILMLYNYQEAKSISKIALQFILKMGDFDYSYNIQSEVPQMAFGQIHEFINHLQWGEPIQYVTGEAHFLGFDFIVSPGVLIPRRETEELVELIISENKSRDIRNILDIGTGSGCIAIMLKKKFIGSGVYGLDISDIALEIASRNAMRLHADVEFLRGDILEMEALAFEKFDIIVSNPPYVTQQEKEWMHKNVLDYEPHLALFVPGEDALLFFRKISKLAKENLNAGGKLYFEVNENYAKDVKIIMEENQFRAVEIVLDMQGKERIVKGTV